MKKLALIALGLFLTALAVTCWVHMDPVTAVVGAALAYGAYAAFRKAGRDAPPALQAQRPWER